MRPRVLTISPYAVADADFVATAQTPSAGGIQELTLTADPVVMDFRRQVEITSDSNDSARVFVVTGTDAKGNQLVEAVQGPNTGSVETVRAFTTVTSVKIDDDAAGVITVGIEDIISSNWLPLDYLVTDFQVSLGITVPAAATADLTVELTLSNLLDYQGNEPLPVRGQTVRSEFDRFFPTINIFDHDSLVNITADQTGNLAFPVRAVRLKSNAVLTGDSVELEVIQASHRSS
jgi:hypothetical protein